MKSTNIMYLLVFKNISENQAQFIKKIFDEFNWKPGFNASVIIENQIINKNL